MKTLKTGVVYARLFLALALPLGASASQVTITWNLAPAEEQVAGYRIYLFVEQFALPPIDVGYTNAYSFPDLSVDLRSLIFVTAYDSTGRESEASGVVEYPDESACLFVNTPAGAIVSAFRTTDEFFVTTRTEPICPVEISTDVPWISVTSAASQDGRIRVSYTIDRNLDSSSRVGTIQTGLGEPFSILQTGAFPSVPTFISLPPPEVSADEGGVLALSAQVDDPKDVQVQWFKDGGPIAGATDFAYTRSPITLADEGNYWVTVSNENGTALGTITKMTVYQKPRFIAQPQTTVVILGEAAFIFGTAAGNDLRYVWKKDGVLQPNFNQFIIIFAAANQSDLGAYQLIVSNKAGVIESEPAYLLTREFEQALGRIHVGLLSDGNLFVQGEGIPGASYDVQISRDLDEWSTFDSLVVSDSGLFTIESPQPAFDPYGRWFVRTVRHLSSK